jgi:hypothetical protein
MPASGARSGTQPGRSERGAGNGAPEKAYLLECGHETPGPAMVRFQDGRQRFACEQCGGLIRREKGTR